MKTRISLFVLFIISLSGYSQNTISGLILDASTLEPMVGASVSCITDNSGVIADTNGKFSLSSTHDSILLKISYVGYLDTLISCESNCNLGFIYLQPIEQYLSDITIYAQLANNRKTPIVSSTIKSIEIEEKIGASEFPMILKQTPGVHPNIQGGGWGDSELYMRGFDNSNIAILVNGIPVNDMENGVVYWSNWAGLVDVTKEIQTQRGVTSSYLSSPAIGGSVNIITNGIDSKRRMIMSYSVGNDGYNKILVSASTGLLKNGWSFSILGSKTWGNGYAIGTNFSSYNYFVNIAKRINTNHQLSLTAFGAPQEHYSRSNALKQSDWDKVKNFDLGGKDWRCFNPDYGFDSDGNRKTSDFNKYHKPTISLNHIWQINPKSSLSTNVYASIGVGYAASGDANSDIYSEYDWFGASNGELNMKFRTLDGTFNYAKIEELNSSSEFGSQMIMTHLKTDFQWYGFVSTYSTNLFNCLSFTSSIDIRYYKGRHTNVISDLFGGAYYIDPIRKTINLHDKAIAADENWVNEQLHVGDVVHRDYDGNIMQEGFSAQLEYNKNKISAVLSGSINNSTFWRYDRLFYDAENARSENANHIGGTVKAGVSYNITDNHKIFANIGYISKVPPFKKGIFMSVNTSNIINKDVHNESAILSEIGYGFTNQYVKLNANAYLIEWMDKTMTKSGVLKDNENYYINMTGVSSKHMGFELAFTSTPTKWLELSAMLSLGNWYWDRDSVMGYAYNSYGQAITPDGDVTTIGAVDHAHAIINMKGIKVGGSAQTTASLDITFKPYKGFKIATGYTLYDRNYAYFSVGGNKLKIGKVMNVSQAWKIPTGGNWDLRASYDFAIKDIRFTLYGIVNNILNQYYIEKAWNPSNISTNIIEVNPADVYMFYSQGTTWNVKLKIEL